MIRGSNPPSHPRAPHGSLRSPLPRCTRCVLDALHGEPPVQGEAAPALPRRAACTTSLRTAGRSSMAPRGSGASMPAMAAARSPKRWRASWPRWTSRPHSRWPIRPHSSWRTRSRGLRRQGSIACSSPTQARSRWTPRSRSLSPIIGCGVMPRAPSSSAGSAPITVSGSAAFPSAESAATARRGRLRSCRAWTTCLIPTTSSAMPSHAAGPPHGVELAGELERLLALHDPSTVAAVIVEPLAGSTGVLIPPRGYLERLRQICDRHGILLIFDEVITGVRTCWRAVCRPGIRRDPRHDHHGQGADERCRADGRGAREALHP